MRGGGRWAVFIGVDDECSQSARSIHICVVDFLLWKPQSFAGSGKSMMIRNLVERPQFGYSTFYGLEISIISETLGIDKCWGNLPKKLPKEHLMNKWDDDATVKANDEIF